MKNCIYKGVALTHRGKYRGTIATASPSTKESMKSLFNHMLSYAVEARIVERNYAREFSLDQKVFKEKEENAKVVFIGPCTAKKAEALKDDVKPYVDSVLTFEELQALFDSKDIDIMTLE